MARRARANPDEPKVPDEDAAVGMFVTFNSFDPKQLTYEPQFQWPERVRCLGEATWITYRSKKVIPDNGVKPRGWQHYNSGVSSYACDGKPDTDVPLFITDCTALALLGDCTGIGFGKTGEGKTTAPYPELYATPCGRALILVQSKRKVVGMIWGGGLDVQDRGIVG